MSASTPALGRANQACKRCHTRKKRFQEQAEESGVFSVTYVRGLENKVRQLEEQVRFLSSVASPNSAPETGRETHDAIRGLSVDGVESSPASVSHPVRPSTAGDSLAAELKWLSLEATAERYLGSSSGLSFARLTQAVLKRLKSDQYPFAFESSPSSSQPQPEGDALTTVDSAVNSMYTTEPLSLPSIIDEEHALRLADYYWQHNHTLYPFVRKVSFMDNLKRMYAQPDDYTLQSRSWLYTMWMVLAIGSTARSSIMVDEESESVQYFDRAMEHFEGALSFGATGALSAILLQVSYSFFNKVGPNTWYLVGVGVRIAIGIGLHTAPSPAVQKLPLDVQEYRKRLFFCLYMMDRVVSISLGRPFGIQDHDVEIEPFANVDDENILPDMILPQSQLRTSAIAVPLHILALRKISGEIFEQVYSNRNRNLNGAERDMILHDIHQKLIDWRRGMPFPLPQSTSLMIPHFSTAWYDLNYYQHVLMAYRPSPLFPVLTLEKVGLIAEASTMFIAQVAIMQRQKRYAFNWLNLFTVFTATLTLIYSITAQPEPIPTYLTRTGALNDLATVSELLLTFGRKFPSALKCHEIVQDVMRRLESLMGVDATVSSSQSHLPVPISLISQGLTSYIPPQSTTAAASDEVVSESNIAYPFVNTGNASYDDLQHRIKGLESPTVERNDNTFDIITPSADPEHVDDFGLSSTPFGNAAAQFMAAGLGTSADMDMDEEMMHFIGVTTDGWGR
ncbi:hypothetical protein MBLNU459_g5006t2 [Dothideomycetes sp. NU459]